MANSTNKIAQMVTDPVGYGSGIRFDYLGSPSSAGAANNWISGNTDKTGGLFDPTLDTSSSFYGDLAGSAIGDVDDKLRKMNIALTSAQNSVNNPSASTDTLKPAEIQRLTKESRQKTANDYLEQNKFAVRLISVANKEKVVFKSSPTNITESRNAVYRPMDVTHLPGNYQIYSHTMPRTWNLTIKLFSRNGIEAEENLATLTTLKSWLLPYFGQSKTSGVGEGMNNSAYSAELLGAPPDILRFTAYSDPTKSGLANINNVPCIMTQVDSNYPDDVDYIQCSSSKVPFPTIISVNIMLMEVHSPNEFKKFNIVDYKNGRLTAW